MSDFYVPLRREKVLGMEANPWYWNPTSPYAIPGPDWFARKLKEFDPEGGLACTWNPINERWQIWARSPRINHRVCRGWSLLFIHQDADHNYLPLDERVFARLYSASAAKHGSAKAYFTRIASEHERDAEKREERLRQEAIDRAMPQFDYSKIKVGYGKSNGSKFSTFFA